MFVLNNNKWLEKFTVDRWFGICICLERTLYAFFCLWLQKEKGLEKKNIKTNYLGELCVQCSTLT